MRTIPVYEHIHDEGVHNICIWKKKKFYQLKRGTHAFKERLNVSQNVRIRAWT